MSRSVCCSVGLMLLTAGLTVALAQQPKDREGKLKVGDIAPAFSLEQLDSGKTVKLTDLRGKPVVLVFGSCT